MHTINIQRRRNISRWLECVYNYHVVRYSYVLNGAIRTLCPILLDFLIYSNVTHTNFKNHWSCRTSFVRGVARHTRICQCVVKFCRGISLQWWIQSWWGWFIPRSQGVSRIEKGEFQNRERGFQTGKFKYSIFEDFLSKSLVGNATIKALIALQGTCMSRAAAGMYNVVWATPHFVTMSS